MSEYTDTDSKNDGSKPFLSLSQLPSTIPSTNADYITTQSSRSHTKKEHTLNAGLKSPISAVPLEILQSIFIACLSQGFVEADPHSAPMLLCQICRYWRNAALALPVLWASFKVRRFNTGTCRPALPLAEMWLERSYPLPMSVCLPVDNDRGCEPKSDDVRAMLWLFLKHPARLKAMHLCLRDLFRYKLAILGHQDFRVLEEIELCFPPDGGDSIGATLNGLGGKLRLGGIVPSIWTSSSRLRSLTLNATCAHNVMEILRTCPNIHDCEFHVTDSGPVYLITDTKLTLPSLHTLNIRTRLTFFSILNAITTPALRTLTMKGEKWWDQTRFEDFLHRSSCSIEEFSMMNITIGPDDLLRTLEHIGADIKILRIHNYPRRWYARPISGTILRGITSNRLVPNVEVIDFGCDSMEPEHELFEEMISSRLGLASEPSSLLDLDSGPSSHLDFEPSSLLSPKHPFHVSPGPSTSGQPRLRRICLSPDEGTAHLHMESLAFVEALGEEGMDVHDDPEWRAYRIDGWYRGVRNWPE